MPDRDQRLAAGRRARIIGRLLKLDAPTADTKRLASVLERCKAGDDAGQACGSHACPVCRQQQRRKFAAATMRFVKHAGYRDRAPGSPGQPRFQTGAGENLFLVTVKPPNGALAADRLIKAMLINSNFNFEVEYFKGNILSHLKSIGVTLFIGALDLEIHDYSMPDANRISYNLFVRGLMPTSDYFKAEKELRKYW